jgi:hypothetical protein
MAEPTPEELQAARDRLCLKVCHRRRGFPVGTCVRPKGHDGQCKPIEDGMTQREALVLSGIDPDTGEAV